LYAKSQLRKGTCEYLYAKSLLFTLLDGEHLTGQEGRW